MIFETHEVPLAPPEVRPAIYVEGPKPKLHKQATAKKATNRHKKTVKSKKRAAAKAKPAKKSDKPSK